MTTSERRFASVKKAGGMSAIKRSSVASASVTGHNPAGATGTVKDSSIGTDRHQYIVNLENVANAQYLTITLQGVHDSAGADFDLPVTFGVLVGDITANGVVTNTDVASVKAQVNPTVSVGQNNFRQDVSGNGFVTNTDVGITKAQVDPTSPITSSNFRDDVSTNGFVTNTDVGLVKSHVDPTGGL